MARSEPVSWIPPTSSATPTNTSNRQNGTRWIISRRNWPTASWQRAQSASRWDNYWFSAAAFASLQTHLPDARFADATALVNWQRAVKSETELDYMRIAGRIVGRMHERIFDKVEPGIRKCDLVADIYDAGLRFDPEIGGGGDYPAIVPLLPSGSDSRRTASDMGRCADEIRRRHLL
jgi:Xaa-Pro aminopeptidase